MTDLAGGDGNATPLSPVERDALIPTHLTLRSELNELEQKNVAEADRWAFSRKRKVLDEVFLCIEGCSIASGDGRASTVKPNGISGWHLI